MLQSFGNLFLVGQLIYQNFERVFEIVLEIMKLGREQKKMC